MKQKALKIAKQVASAPRKIGGVPIEDVVEPHPHNRKRVSLAVAFPEIAAQWYYPKNCGFGPEDFSRGSQVNAWWRCAANADHIWRARILTRAVQGRNCPFCNGTNLRVPVPPERSLAKRYPQLARELHPTRNKGLTGYDLLHHSQRKVWWQCQKNPKHVWECSPDKRINEDSGCVHCYHEQWLDLRKYPEALKLFDRERNKIRKLYNRSTKTLFWWRCPEGPDHSWRSTFKKEGFRCPFCAKRMVSVTNSLKTVFPKLAKQLHPTRNGSLTADKLKSNDQTRVWWRCALNPRHIWRTSVDNRTRNGSECPECWKIRRSSYLSQVAAQRLLGKPVRRWKGTSTRSARQ
jgi:Probable Zinc-ribbon domain